MTARTDVAVRRPLPEGSGPAAGALARGCNQPEADAHQRHRGRFGNGRERRLIDDLGRGTLHTDGEAVPELVGRTAPGDGVERAGEAKGAVRLAAADTVAVQLVLELAPAQIDDDLARAAATPETAGVAVDAAQAQKFEVLIERVAVAFKLTNANTGLAIVCENVKVCVPALLNATMSVPVGRLSTKLLVYGEVAPEPPV